MAAAILPGGLVRFADDGIIAYWRHIWYSPQIAILFFLYRGSGLYGPGSLSFSTA